MRALHLMETVRSNSAGAGKVSSKTTSAIGASPYITFTCQAPMVFYIVKQSCAGLGVRMLGSVSGCWARCPDAKRISHEEPLLG